MGRLLCIGAITVVFVALAAIAITMTVARTGRESERMSGEPHAGMLRLQVDERISPSAIEPGGRFRYGFRIINTGDVTLRNIAVRSEKARDDRPAGDVRVLSVSDRMCAVNGLVSCLFPELPPGTARSVQVVALAVRPRLPGDQVMIQTFAGSFVPDPAGGVDFSVIGEAHETVGRFRLTVPHPDRAKGGARDGAAGGADGRTGGRADVPARGQVDARADGRADDRVGARPDPVRRYRQGDRQGHGPGRGPERGQAQRHGGAAEHGRGQGARPRSRSGSQAGSRPESRPESRPGRRDAPGPRSGAPHRHR